MMKRTMLFSVVAIASLLFSFMLSSFAQAQSVISYLIPDIGTPDFNTYIEVIGTTQSKRQLRNPGSYLNNPAMPCVSCVQILRIRIRSLSDLALSVGMGK